MSELAERRSFENLGRRIERFEDFGIAIGDRIYSKSGTYREVRDIHIDESNPSDGFLEVERVSPDGDRYIHNMSFDKVLSSQENIARIEKPVLPEGITIDNDSLPNRYRAAFKQIESQLNDPETPAENKPHLLRSKANLIREISYSSTNERERAEFVGELYREAAERVMEVVNPESGDALRRLIKSELFDNQDEPVLRDRQVKTKGYDSRALRELGDRITDKVKWIDELWESGVKIDEKTFMESMKLPQLTRSGKGRDKVLHSNITIGASAEVSRQMRKILALTIEDDPKAAYRIIYSPDAAVSYQDVVAYVAKENKDPSGVHKRQMIVFKWLGGDDSKKTLQYIFAARLLNHEGKIPQ